MRTSIKKHYEKPLGWEIEETAVNYINLTRYSVFKNPNTRLESDESEYPVEEGERRTVEIEDLGDQGDGLTRVERGFVVIVPETEMGERVTVEISDVRKNVAFGEVINRLS